MGRGTADIVAGRAGNRVALFTSAPLLAELGDILGRSKFEKKIAVLGYSVDQLVDSYAELAKLVRPVAIAPTSKDDPDDDQVLACAVAARADVIVSGDHHLLDLGGFEGISIITVAEAAKRTDIDTLGR